MLIVRLVILAILAYIAWVLIRGIFSGLSSPAKKDETGSAGENSQSQDVLVEDPVCHTLVPKHQAIRMRKDGKTYYFCSDECCDKFSEKERGVE